MNEKVSVLMCTYNSGEFLRQAIEGVLYQPYENFELIIIDDASTDDSRQIAQEYAALDPRVKTIECPVNRGASTALNAGLRLASGDYLTRHDSDDIMFPERLAEQVNFLRQHPEVGAVGTNVVYIDHQGNEFAVSSFPLTNEEIQAALPDYMCFCGPTILVRREAFVQAGYYFVEHYSTAEDYDLCLRLSEVTQMANLERPLYRYRQHPNSVSVTSRYWQLYCKVRSLEQAAMRRFGVQLPPEFVGYIARDYLRAAILAFLSGQPAHARRCLAIGQRYRPDLLGVDAVEPPLGEIINRYLPEQSFDATITDIEGLFRDLFPRRRDLARQKAHLLAEKYIQEAFARAQNSPSRSFDLKLIWKGVRYDPAWLTNRGIASILVKQGLRNMKNTLSTRLTQNTPS